MQINIPTDRLNNAKHKVVNKIKEIKPMPRWAIYTLIATAERFQYEKKVLQAFNEVNNAVTSYSSANKQAELMENLKNSAKKYLDLAQVQHINGQINYIDVLDAQRSYLNAEIDLSYAIRDKYIALIELYKSLGGGWQNQ